MDDIEAVDVGQLMNDLNDRIFKQKEGPVTNSFTANFNKYEFAIFLNKVQRLYKIEFEDYHLLAFAYILEVKRLLEKNKSEDDSYFVVKDIFEKILDCTNIENIFIGMEEEGIEDESTESDQGSN